MENCTFKYNKVYIYFLICPIDNCVKYIGESVNPIIRYKWHMNNNCHTKFEWLQKLDKKGLKPTLCIVSSHPSKKEAKEIERHLIQEFSKINNLLNKTHNQ